MTELDKEIKNSTILVHPDKYAYLKTDEEPSGNHFLVAKDEDEITIVTKECEIDNLKYSESTKWFKLFEIKPYKPFLTVGFLAKITKTIADKGLNVLIVSTYSKDYILIEFEKADIAEKALKNLSFTIINTET